MKKFRSPLVVIFILIIIVIGVIKVNEEIPNNIRTRAAIAFSQKNNPFRFEIQTENYTIYIDNTIPRKFLNNSLIILGKLKMVILNSLSRFTNSLRI